MKKQGNWRTCYDPPPLLDGQVPDACTRCGVPYPRTPTGVIFGYDYRGQCYYCRGGFDVSVPREAHKRFLRWQDEVSRPQLPLFPLPSDDEVCDRLSQVLDVEKWLTLEGLYRRLDSKWRAIVPLSRISDAIIKLRIDGVADLKTTRRVPRWRRMDKSGLRWWELQFGRVEAKAS